MTKPLPTGCIKDNNDLSWKTFNTFLEKDDLEIEIGHLYIVNIMFDAENASKKQLVYNEIYLPIIEKRKLLILVRDQYFRYQNSMQKEKIVIH